MKINSIKFHICVLYVGIIGLVFVAYRGLLYFDLRRSLYEGFDRQLRIKSSMVAKTIKAYADAAGKDSNALLFCAHRAICVDASSQDEPKMRALDFQWVMQVNKLGLLNDFIYLTDAQGRALVHSNNITPGLLDQLLKTSGNKNNGESINETYLKEARKSLRIISVPFLFSDNRYRLHLGSSATQINGLLAKRMRNELILIPFTLLVMALISLIFVLRILKPVFAITKAAKNISYKNLSARVKVERLEEEMKYLAEAFNEMIGRLEKSFNYITEFSAQVSHELKTPLSIIKGESELALRKERSSQEYQTALKAIAEEVKRMLKIIADLLILAKLSYQSEVIQFEKFNLVQFLQEIYEEMNILAADKGIAISISIDAPQEATLNGNKLHLRRLFYNLLDNAIKFTPRGGRISIRLMLEKNKAKVEIADTGSGIPSEELPRIFRKFFILDKQEKEGELIHGLGLNIVQHIVKLHQGDISVQSEVGKGSTFIVILPLA